MFALTEISVFFKCLLLLEILGLLYEEHSYMNEYAVFISMCLSLTSIQNVYIQYTKLQSAPHCFILIYVYSILHSRRQ